ncbi:MAG: sigma-70 family RNA polymerase sigma factor [Phycisphaerae bacterium]|nr:sigma-70 family RNA polymerase sigma factor [Phycisphaerae bacterium]
MGRLIAASGVATHGIHAKREWNVDSELHHPHDPDSSAPSERSADQLLPEVYDELHALAERFLFRERPDHTLQPTALINEAYLRLSEKNSDTWNDRSHFVLIAARAMRQILVNHAVHRGAQKRGGNWREIALDEAVAIFSGTSIDIIALDEALAKLSELDEIQGRIVELRYFGGLTTDEAASVLGLSVRTLEREWSMARAWLRRELDDTGG